jgi:hypothetical protein
MDAGRPNLGNPTGDQMAKKQAKEMNEGHSDVASVGYRKMAFGGSEPDNYLIKDAWNRQPEGDEEESTNIHEIAEQLTVSDFYSADKHVAQAHGKQKGGNENG